MINNSSNEWSDLKKVIVGIADHAIIPQVDKSLRTVSYSHIVEDTQLPTAGPYPDKVIEEANQDLDILSTTLVDLGIEVVRPFNTPTQYYNYCPRDLVTIIGTKNIVTPMSIKSREGDYKNILDYLYDPHIIQNDQSDLNYNLSSIGNKNILALNEINPKFDAANIIRANNDILYLISNSGNKKGAEYLQDYLGHEYKVHILEGVYSYMHIDSTIAFLKEGLLLLNPSRIKDKDLLPFPFNKWDAIICPDPVDIGFYKEYNNASPWINVNLLSINENLVIIEEHQTNLREELYKYGIESIMLPMRHARTLGGCFHCVTLDLVRE